MELREINILCCQEDENGGRLGEGQSDSPYLITISLITIPTVEYYTMHPRKYYFKHVLVNP